MVEQVLVHRAYSSVLVSFPTHLLLAVAVAVAGEQSILAYSTHKSLKSILTVAGEQSILVNRRSLVTSRQHTAAPLSQSTLHTAPYHKEHTWPITNTAHLTGTQTSRDKIKSTQTQT